MALAEDVAGFFKASSIDGLATGVVLLTVVLASASAKVLAQQPPGAADDTTRVFMLEGQVVTADRAESTIGSSVSAVSLVSSQQLARFPVANLAEVLRLVPGFTLVDFDGLGQDPQMIVRGFYGGGETDYVTVMLDGRPLNNLQSGMMIWDLIPPVAIGAIEVVRGPSSALYGDGAVAGVINLISANNAPEGGFWDFGIGDPRSFRGSVRAVGDFASRPVTVFAEARRIEGYRKNAARTVGNAGARVDILSGEERSLSLSAHWMWRDVQRPGPRPENKVEVDPRPIEIFYSYDGTQAWLARADLEGSIELSPGSQLSSFLSTEVRRRDEIRTVQPSLDKGYTKERFLDTNRLFGTVKLEKNDLGFPWSDRLIVGVDASTGHFESEHHDVVTGGPLTYVFGTPTRPLVASGQGTRNAAAGFAQYEFRPIDVLRISVGGRFDVFSDSFRPDEPSPDVSVTAEITAFSPKAGVNLSWIESARQTGHIYLTVGRTFKAPNPDQLFDQRSVPVLPTVEVPVSNPLLRPQHGVSLEAGAYHGVVISPGSWTGDLSLAVYQIDMEDEIKFDVGTFTYGNIAESRHRGVEAGVNVRGPSASTFFVNYALQNVTAQSGVNNGNFLKAIPHHTLSGGASGMLMRNLELGIYLTRHSSAWLDDENTERLPAFTRIDTRTSLSVRNLEFSLQLLNLFNRAYSTTGFLDPGSRKTVLLFPAAKRALEVGLRVGV
ncbi:MAG TPA: TonB-dependent receptor [Gemmatimonadetes bacterium]|nr:TonB-dependent receptor [Gemmatimonadota bacterium]